jgi:TonB family protein
MNKLRHYLPNLLLPALAITCTVAAMCAQDSVPGPNTLPVILDPRKMAKLAMAQPAPEYPAVAKINFLQGMVQLEVTINSKGNVAAVHVVDGNPILAAAAIKAVRQWIYHPLTTASGPSGFMTTVRLNFSLRHRAKDLTPRQAEQDFDRQVKPPQMNRPPEDARPQELVHMRLLVNDQGQVVDREVSPLSTARFEAACETLRSWTFRPAHWGSLPIASYLLVDVPVSATSVVRAAATAASR